MHENFADWYQPVTFGHSNETIELRWEGVNAAFNDLNETMILDLIRLVYGRNVSNKENLTRFREYFKKQDATFKSSGNEKEISVLAGCVLILAISDPENDWGEFAIPITTSSFINQRKHSLDVDLVRLAEDRIENDAALIRKRPTIGDLEMVNSDEFAEILEGLQDNSQLPNVVSSLKSFVKALKIHTEVVQENIKEHLIQVNRVIDLQDEELQSLWWIIGNRSVLWDESFDKMDEAGKVLLLSKEFTNFSNFIQEPPSIKSLLEKSGISSKKQNTIPDLVNGCSHKQLSKLIDTEKICPTISPVSAAIERAVELEGDESWVPVWSKTTGISESAKFPQIEIALQFVRELNFSSFAEG